MERSRKTSSFPCYSRLTIQSLCQRKTVLLSCPALGLLSADALCGMLETFYENPSIDNLPNPSSSTLALLVPQSTQKRLLPSLTESVKYHQAFLPALYNRPYMK